MKNFKNICRELMRTLAKMQRRGGGGNPYGQRRSWHFVNRFRDKNLGFLLLHPKLTTSNGYFNAVVIFTPKLGLFNETPPQ
ncbi:MAG: hypothetical protein LBF57_04090 [Holosporaceae bacterium]|jgi:hypothetical protein|nr:hypothetical protein [Holosporaceae bacterium]